MAFFIFIKIKYIIYKPKQLYGDNSMAINLNEKINPTSKELNDKLSLKDDISNVDNKLSLKANQSDMDNALLLKANINDVNNSLDTKVDKEDGKTLSTNDFTALDKSNLDNLVDTSKIKVYFLEPTQVSGSTKIERKSQQTLINISERDIDTVSVNSVETLSEPITVIDINFSDFQKEDFIKIKRDLPRYVVKVILRKDGTTEEIFMGSILSFNINIGDNKWVITK